MSGSGASSATAKRYRRGTHRVRPPEETWEAVSPLAERAGITRVADVTRLDRLGVPVWQAIRPASRNLCVSQGKGVTVDAARVSALMESLELWTAERLDGVSRVVATLRAMLYDHPFRAEDFPWLEGAPALWAAPIPWVAATSLTGGESTWLPEELVAVDFTLPETVRPRMFHGSSNGLASGNCREEALLHALCELIERHGLHLARREGAERVAIAPDTVDDPDCRLLIDGFRAAGARVGLFDLTWELGVPVVQVDLVLPDLPNVWIGAGCHPAPEVALARALTEAAQSRLTYISGARDDLPALRPGGGWHRSFAAYTEPAGGRAFSDLPDLAGESVEDDLAAIVARLAEAGHPPFAIDLARKELTDELDGEVPFAVVRTFAPGLAEVSHH